MTRFGNCSSAHPASVLGKKGVEAKAGSAVLVPRGTLSHPAGILAPGSRAPCILSGPAKIENVVC
jgi:hypothetical protein